MGRQVAGRWDLAIDVAVEIDRSEVFGRADRRAWQAGEARGHRDGHRFSVCRITTPTASPEISDSTAASLIAHTSRNVSATAPADSAPIAKPRSRPKPRKDLPMSQSLKTLALSIITTFTPGQAAEREQVRMVINLIAGVEMPFPEHLRNNVARTERVRRQWRYSCLPAPG